MLTDRVGSRPTEPDTPGSYLYAPEDNTEQTVMIVRVTGTNINFNEDASFHSLLDAMLLRHLTDTVSAAQGDEPRYLQGGAAGYTLNA